MKVYIAGPISGYDSTERMRAFRAYEKTLRARGFEVINPFDCHPLGVRWEEAMRADIAALVTADVIALLPGWEHSRGVRLELHIALELGMQVLVGADLLFPTPS